jgi:uncharacterized protein YbjT (DUF2867 family)
LHFAGKYTVERMIEDCNLPATILRPNYFMQNDASMRTRSSAKASIRSRLATKAFAKETEIKIIAEIAKDLTNHTIAEIERLLTAG